MELGDFLEQCGACPEEKDEALEVVIEATTRDGQLRTLRPLRVRFEYHDKKVAIEAEEEGL